MAKKIIMKIDILGTEYKVYTDSSVNDDRLRRNDGYIIPEKKIIILDQDNSKVHQQHVIKHEIVHAFCYESGLDVESWANNEETIDWIAIQLFKMSSTVKNSLNVLKGVSYGRKN